MKNLPVSNMPIQNGKVAKSEGNFVRYLKYNLRRKNFFLFVFILALVARFLFWAFVNSKYLFFADTEEYFAVAESICSGNGYPFKPIFLPVFRAPGFPFFLAGVTGCGFFSKIFVQYLLIFLDSLACVLAYFTVFNISLVQNLKIFELSALRENSARIRAAIAGIIFAIYPHFIQQSVNIQSEPLTHFLIIFVAFIFSVIIFFSNSYIEIKSSPFFRTIILGAITGIACGYAVLVRPSSQVLLLPILFSLYLFYRQYKAFPIVLIIFSILTIMPWSRYASKANKKFVMVNDAFCYSTYRGSHPELLNIYLANDFASFEVARQATEGAFREAEKVILKNKWCDEAISQIKKDPLYQLKLAGAKLLAFFRPWPHHATHNLYIVFAVGVFVSLLYYFFICSLGSSLTNASIQIRLMALVYVIAVGLAHVPHQVSNRYRIPYIDGLLIIWVCSQFCADKLNLMKRPRHL